MEQHGGLIHGEVLKAMPYAETQAEGARQRDTFVRLYRKTDPKAVDTLLRDWDRMVTFCAFPKEHWIHLRTTNIVESPFASVRLRTDAARRYKRVEGAQAIIWKMLGSPSRRGDDSMRRSCCRWSPLVCRSKTGG
jgi:putative transposase